MVAPHIAEAMRAKYPQADFTRYFAFMEKCATQVQAGETHKHHIAPKEQFPELRRDVANLLPLTVENHWLAHDILGQSEPALAHATPQFIAAASTGGRLARKTPQWLAACRTAMRKLTSDPKWLAINRRARARTSLIERPLPVKEIVAMYQRGMDVPAIALAIGNPVGHGKNRVREALVKAGVYKKKSAAHFAAQNVAKGAQNKPNGTY